MRSIPETGGLGGDVVIGGGVVATFEAIRKT